MSVSFIEYLNNIVDKLQMNLYEYEEFHQDRLLDIRNMEPLDAFLYGIATGKLDSAKEIRNLIEELLRQYNGE